MGWIRARDNPFRVQRLNRLAYRAPGFQIQELLNRWRAMNSRGSLVGPKGRGKTTLLHEIEIVVDQDHPVVGIKLREGDSRLSPADLERIEALEANGVVLLDGLEQLSEQSWHKLDRGPLSEQSLIATSHRAGRLPTLLTCDTTVEGLSSLVDELAPEIPLDFEQLERLFRRHEGNLRTALLELYDRYSKVGEDLVKSDFRKGH